MLSNFESDDIFSAYVATGDRSMSYVAIYGFERQYVLVVVRMDLMRHGLVLWEGRLSFLSWALVSVALVYTDALAEVYPRVRPASPVQYIASASLPFGNGHNPETPDFCVLPSKNIVALWRADRYALAGQNATHSIWWRYFSPSLVPLTDPVPVGPDEEGFGSRNTVFPACIPTDDGGFMIAWEKRLGMFPDRADIVGQLFTSAGEPIDEEFALTQETSVEEYMTQIVSTADEIVVGWTSFDEDYFREKVVWRRFDHTGMPLSDDTLIAGNGGADEPNRRRAQLASSGERVVAAWSEVVPGAGSTPAHEAIFARYLNDSSEPAMISDDSATNALCSDVAMTTSGAAVLWVSSKRSLRVRGVSPTGQPVGPVHTLAEVTDGFVIADGPSVAAAPDGSSYIAVWGKHDDKARESTLWAQLLTAGVTPDGSPYRIARLDRGGDYRNRLRFPGVAYVTSTSMVIGWEYFRQPPGPTPVLEVFVQLFEIGKPDSECGDVNRDGTVAASDALLILSGAVGLTECSACACDVNTSGTVTSSDALAVLRASVGVPTVLECPICDR